MPRGDRNGPVGNGPMTGRAAGFCAGQTAPGYMNANPGSGGRGGGHGRRNRFYATGMTRWQPSAWAAPQPFPFQPVAMQPIGPQPEQEAEVLRNQIKFFEDNIRTAEERISELSEKGVPSGSSGEET